MQTTQTLHGEIGNNLYRPNYAIAVHTATRMQKSFVTIVEAYASSAQLAQYAPAKRSSCLIVGTKHTIYSLTFLTLLFANL